MSVVASRDLRNHTADVLRSVADGERITVTVNGRPVAEIGPVTSSRSTTIGRAELARLLFRTQADAGLREDLAALGDDSTDVLS